MSTRSRPRSERVGRPSSERPTANRTPPRSTSRDAQYARIFSTSLAAGVTQTCSAPRSAKTTVLSPAPVSTVRRPGRTAASMVSSTSVDACSETGLSPSSTWNTGASRRRTRRSIARAGSVLLRRRAQPYLVHLHVRRLAHHPEDRRGHVFRREHLDVPRRRRGIGSRAGEDRGELRVDVSRRDAAHADRALARTQLLAQALRECANGELRP